LGPEFAADASESLATVGELHLSIRDAVVAPPRAPAPPDRRQRGRGRIYKALKKKKRRMKRTESDVKRQKSKKDQTATKSAARRMNKR
jgi:hypothetical protein